jgi:hypothetical protein
MADGQCDHGDSVCRLGTHGQEAVGLLKKIDMQTNTACEALRSGQRLEVRYHGFTRVVEVHTCGITTADNRAIRVWQVRGGSVSNEPAGWKVLLLDEAISLGVLDEKSSAPRPGYRRGDRMFTTIFCQI